MPVTLNLVAPNAGFQVCHTVVHAGAIYGVANGGKLYVFTGSAWSVVVNTSLAGSTIYHRLVSAGGNLYVVNGAAFVVGAAPVWVWDGATAWTSLNLAGTYGASSFFQVNSAIVHGGLLTLEITLNTNRRVVQWSGSAWTNLSGTYLTSLDDPFFLVSFGGALYGTSLRSKLYSIIGGVITAVSGDATTGGFPGLGLSISPLIDFQSSLYMGHVLGAEALALGVLFQWNGVNAWVSVVPYDVAYTQVRTLFLFGVSLAMVRDNSDIYVFDGVSAWTTAVTLGGTSFSTGLGFSGSTYVLGRQGGVLGDLYQMIPPAVSGGIFPFGGLG